MTEKNLFKYYPVLFKGLNENGQSSSFFEEIHALISDYAQITVQSSVSCCNFLFISIVSVQWPMVGRPAWCHILSEKMFRLFHTYSFDFISKTSVNVQFESPQVIIWLIWWFKNIFQPRDGSLELFVVSKSFFASKQGNSLFKMTRSISSSTKR